MNYFYLKMFEYFSSFIIFTLKYYNNLKKITPQINNLFEAPELNSTVFKKMLNLIIQLNDYTVKLKKKIEKKKIPRIGFEPMTQ